MVTFIFELLTHLNNVAINLDQFTVLFTLIDITIESLFVSSMKI